MPTITVQPEEFDVEIEVSCLVCGYSLSGESSGASRRGSVFSQANHNIEVPPCPRCLNEAVERALEEEDR